MNNTLMHLLQPFIANNVQPCIVHAPYMHAEYTSASAPSTIFHFSCGMAKEMDNMWQPATVPFSGSQARAVLAEMLEFGNTAGTLDTAILIAEKNFAGEQKIKQALKQEMKELSELTSLPKTPVSPLTLQEKETEAKNFSKYITAQKQLLLAWYLEEQCLELQAMEHKFKKEHTMFSNNLSPENERVTNADENPERSDPKPDNSKLDQTLNELLSNLPLEFAYTAELPNPAHNTLVGTWEKTLWSMKALAPECMFYIEEPAIIQALIEKDCTFSPLPKDVHIFLSHLHDVNFLNTLQYSLLNKTADSADYTTETTGIILTQVPS